jgi:hypothetical protein
MCVTSLEGINDLLFMNKKGFLYKSVCLIVLAVVYFTYLMSYLNIFHLYILCVVLLLHSPTLPH